MNYELCCVMQQFINWLRSTNFKWSCDMFFLKLGDFITMMTRMFLNQNNMETRRSSAKLPMIINHLIFQCKLPALIHVLSLKGCVKIPLHTRLLVVIYYWVTYLASLRSISLSFSWSKAFKSIICWAFYNEKQQSTYILCQVI